MSTPATCKVIAPASLKAGATFEASVDGITFTATVPEGGVEEGDAFEVAYPSTKAVNAFEVPKGQFRNKLCGCFGACCCPFWMACCFEGIVLGQVLERNNFNFTGCPRENADGTPDTSPGPPICKVYTGITLASILLGGVVMGAVNPEYGQFFLSAASLYWLVVVTCTRYNMRKKYAIEPSCCGDNCCGDCLAAWCCPCCSVIQMATHTHDDDQYPYDIMSPTGLNRGAPAIV
eukprot:jgi/Psemu1/310185/fgenesh1_kg.602_\